MNRTVITSLGLMLTIGLSGVRAAPAPPPLWVTAYYPVWNQEGGMGPDKIDYSAITHLVHFAIVPHPDGTLGGITPAQSADVVTRAHKGGDKVLVCLGGASTGPVLGLALTDAARPAFIKNLIGFVAARGYDGLDVDMEPILPADEPDFIKFITDLRAAMKAADPKWLLTIPASGEPGAQSKLCARLQSDFDQINVQTYDLSGAWPGFKTWYNGSLYGDGKTLLTATRPYPSVDDVLSSYLAAGVPRAKLGIGLAFYGYVWTGANGPTQSIQGVTTTTLTYSAIMDKYYRPDTYHWDALAHAPYLSVGAEGDPARKFISYDDTRLAREKVQYARSHGLGGVIIWELSQGYQDSQPAGRKDALLQAVKRAVAGR